MGHMTAPRRTSGVSTAVTPQIKATARAFPVQRRRQGPARLRLRRSWRDTRRMLGVGWSRRRRKSALVSLYTGRKMDQWGTMGTFGYAVASHKFRSPRALVSSTGG